MPSVRPSPHPSPPLRLVRSAESSSIREADDARAVAHENTLAARLARRGAEADQDVREIFAQQAARVFEGGRAAILRPESRRLLVGDARRLGLRPFEANLIIAVAQDAARSGFSSSDPRAATLVKLIPGPVQESTSRMPVERFAMALAIAAFFVIAIIRWIES